MNWCPELGTVLANEEVIDGKSEVGGFPVVRRPMRQWMLRITAYAERLVERTGRARLAGGNQASATELDRTQRRRGDYLRARESKGDDLRVFTTRPDTIYGATYMVLAPEHPLVDELSTTERKAEVAKYREQVAAKSDLERTDLAKEKSGVFIGAYAINPVNHAKIPIWIADYVLMGYGTGAIMGVPGHDERDLEFARRFDIPIIPVVQMPGKTAEESVGCLDDGVAINSPLINGLPTAEAKRKIVAWLEEKGQACADIRYKLRDWLFSRQRYWGEPFPDRLAGRQARSPAGKRTSARAAGVGRLQTDRHRRTAAGPGERMGALFRRGDARDEHDAAMGRLVLVLPAVLRSAKR